MQNLIVLCQQCYTWIEPQSEMCPDCGAGVDINHPDLDHNVLSEILGKPQAMIGLVRVDRKTLPNFGHLIGTTGGILFLPRLHRRVNGAWEGVTSENLPRWWPFRGGMKSPRFLNWLQQPFGTANKIECRTDKVPQLDLGSLADRLMETPGAFFVEQRAIRGLTARRRMIKLDRTPLRSITIIDETSECSVLMSLNALAAKAYVVPDP